LRHDSIPRYPWGDEWQEGCCNYEGEWRLERPELVSVRKYGPQNPGGVCDIVGNASEMAQDVDAIVQCGGNHNSSKRQIGINKRPFAIARHPVIGFRCVASVEDYEQVVQRK
jgi:formylglycine-generating enzyme required for sulfatase activity